MRTQIPPRRRPLDTPKVLPSGQTDGRLRVRAISSMCQWIGRCFAAGSGGFSGREAKLGQRPIPAEVAMELNEFLRQFIADVQCAGRDRPTGVGLAAASHSTTIRGGPGVPVGDLLDDRLQKSWRPVKMRARSRARWRRNRQYKVDRKRNRHETEGSYSLASLTGGQLGLPGSAPGAPKRGCSHRATGSSLRS